MPEKKNIHAGHRKRMKGEFLVRGLEGLPDHKALELLLFYAIPQWEDTAPPILLIPALGGRYLQERADLTGICQTSWEFKNLLEPEFFGARNERIFLVCLDGKMKLLAPPKLLGEGIADAAAVTTRKVMETPLPGVSSACGGGNAGQSRSNAIRSNLIRVSISFS